MAKRKQSIELMSSPGSSPLEAIGNIGNDVELQEALKSQKKARREATSAAERAENELAHRLKCLEAERAAREQQTMPLDNLTTPKPDRLDSEAFGIHDGAYVSVERDCSPGKCSIGGTGFVQGEPASDGTYTVEYVEWIAFNGCQSHRNHGTKRSH